MLLIFAQAKTFLTPDQVCHTGSIPVPISARSTAIWRDCRVRAYWKGEQTTVAVTSATESPRGATGGLHISGH